MVKDSIENEKLELRRVLKLLKNEEGINITMDELIQAFESGDEVKLSQNVWNKLENTESNEIEKGDTKTLHKLAKHYGKTNPKLIIKSLEDGNYDLPLIIKFDGNRYHLVAGNTRLCTAKVYGITPKVIIADINMKNTKEKLIGGKADNMSLTQIAKKHGAKTNEQVINLVEKLKKQVKIGLPFELEHTSDKSKATEIIYDHLFEDPNYYTKLKKANIDETDSGSSGSYEAPAFSKVIKRKITSIPNANLTGKKEIEEVTTSSSSGSYDVPLFGKTTKGGRKDPLKIDGTNSIYKSRAVTDKNFPKWGGPDGVFIKIKEKCKKFPYCNQGDINSIEMLEIEELNESIKKVSKNMGIPSKDLENIILKEINEYLLL